MKFFLRRFLIGLVFAVSGVAVSLHANADTGGARIGIVLMHGKGGSPLRYISDLADPLRAHGYLVENIEMPWSRKREYDADVGTAEREVESALSSLRSRGAQKLFVAGHSMGGLFALYFGGKHAVDGIIAIAPGGDVGNPMYRAKVGDSVAKARKLIAEGKGDEKASLSDFEGSKGIYPIVATPAVYFSWFDPDGAMNQTIASRNMNPAVPVLFIAPANDYAGLLKVKQKMFDALPRNPHTRLYEPDSSHLQAPSASSKAIIEWTAAVANAK